MPKFSTFFMMISLSILSFVVGCNLMYVKETGTSERPAKIYELSPEKAYALSIQAASNLSWKIEFTDPDQKKIVAYARHVKTNITASRYSETQTQVDVKCILKGTTFDLIGQCDKIIDDFYSEFDQLVARGSAR
jgi:hypothetical protein